MTDTPKDLAELRQAVEAMLTKLRKELDEATDKIQVQRIHAKITILNVVLALIDGLIENLQRRAADYEKISRRLNNVKNHTDEDIALELRSVLGDEK